MRRGSEISDGLRSLEPAIPELEISWVSEEREELEEEECRTGRSLKRSLSPFCQRHPVFDGRKKIYPLNAFSVLYMYKLQLH
jgi:hypothetical protein